MEATSSSDKRGQSMLAATVTSSSSCSSSSSSAASGAKSKFLDSGWAKSEQILQSQKKDKSERDSSNSIMDGRRRKWRNELAEENVGDKVLDDPRTYNKKARKESPLRNVENGRSENKMSVHYSQSERSENESEMEAEQGKELLETCSQVHQKLIICPRCGSYSMQLSSCDRCKKDLPAKKGVGDEESALSKTRNYYSKRIRERFYGESLTRSHKKPDGILKTRHGCFSNAEPECLTISSDEEEEENNTTTNEKISSSASASTSVIKFAQKDVQFQVRRFANVLPETETKSPPTIEKIVALKCRSIRIGSHKCKPDFPVKISREGIKLESTNVKDGQSVLIEIPARDLVQLLFHCSASLIVVFIYTTPGCAKGICSRLQMREGSEFYYDPASMDETQKRITILPEKIDVIQLHALQQIFIFLTKQSKNERFISEIPSSLAHEILVRSTPREEQFVKCNGKTRSATKRFKHQTMKMMIYPPPPETGGIDITSDDYSCLEESQFLNDVIIEFYLRYIFQKKLSEVDRQRTHIFNSYFFRRLTHRSSRDTNRTISTMSPSEQRHSRVMNWTRHLDIFSKDFIIIPINESSHWYLAVICFPSLEVNNNLKSKSKARSPVMEQASGNMSPVIGENGFYDWSMQSTSLSEGLQDSGSEDQESRKEDEEADGNSSASSTKRPCIMIFDSLPGGNKAQTFFVLREYLRLEWQRRKKSERSFNKEIMIGLLPRVPRQTNYSDCGVFLLQYVESFFENPITDFSTSPLNLKSWFLIEAVTQKRKQIRQLIYEMMLEQNGGVDVLRGAHYETTATLSPTEHSAETEKSDSEKTNDEPDADQYVEPDANATTTK